MYLLHGGWLNLEINRDVATKNTSLKGLDVTANIRLRCQQVAVIHIPVRLLVPIRHNDLPSVCFNLHNARGEYELK